LLEGTAAVDVVAVLVHSIELDDERCLLVGENQRLGRIRGRRQVAMRPGEDVEAAACHQPRHSGLTGVREKKRVG
jgi:hypothetical protein